MAVVPVPKEPGRYFDTSTGKYVDIVDYYDGDRYDTIRLASGGITAGAESVLFRDISSKDKIDNNLGQSNRIGQGEQMLVRRVGADVPACFGNVIVRAADVKRVAFNGYLKVKINDRDIAEGPIYSFPSGYGLAGQTTENNASVVSIGVPSTAAQRNLEKSHWLTPQMDVTGTITFWNHTWDVANMPTLDTRVFVRVFVGGLIRLKGR